MELPTFEDVGDEKTRAFLSDPDYVDLCRWMRNLGNEPGENDESRRIVETKSAHDQLLSVEDAKTLRGAVIIIEGGIGQGKTLLCKAIEKIAQKNEIPCHLALEPVDGRALELFMKYGTKRLEEGSPKLIKAAELARMGAAIRMQFSMLRARAHSIEKAARAARDGHLSVVDRGPFGDSAFMVVTFVGKTVPEEFFVRYMIEYQRLYLSIGLPEKKTVIVRMNAPTSITYGRWVQRESAVGGNKYDSEYMERIERAHDACEKAWGKCLLYDNGNVPIEDSGIPSEAVVLTLLHSICEVCRS